METKDTQELLEQIRETLSKASGEIQQRLARGEQINDAFVVLQDDMGNIDPARGQDINALTLCAKVASTFDIETQANAMQSVILSAYRLGQLDQKVGVDQANAKIESTYERVRELKPPALAPDRKTTVVVLDKMPGASSGSIN